MTSSSSVRDNLLTNVSQLSIQGTPGCLSILEANTATAVVAAPGRSDAVLMAAAALGSGKLVIFAQPNYADMFATSESEHAELWRNMRKWMTGVDDTSLVHYLNMDEYLQLGHVYVQKGDNVTSQSAEIVAQYVQHGGSFVYATAPWIYKEYYNPGHDIHDDPFTNKILIPAGVNWLSEYFPCSENTTHVTSEENSAAQNVPLSVKLR